MSTPDTSPGGDDLFKILDDFGQAVVKSDRGDLSTLVTDVNEARDRLNRLMLTRERELLVEFRNKWHNFGLVYISDELDVDKENVIFQERKPIDQLLDSQIKAIDAQLNKEEK